MRRPTNEHRTRLLLLAFLAIMAGRSYAMEAEEAWTAATAMAKAAEAWKAGSLSITTVEYAKDGEEKSREESQFRVRYAPDGSLESDLIRAVKDGKDVTEERRKELASGKRHGWGRPGQGQEGGGMGFPQPFAPADGDVMERGKASLGVHSARAVWVFPFTYRVKGGMRWNGEAILDKENGRPVALNLSAAGGIPGLKSMALTGRYADAGQGGLLESAQMRVIGQFLLKRVDFSFTMAFAEYALSTGAGAAGSVRGGSGTAR